MEDKQSVDLPDPGQGKERGPSSNARESGMLIRLVTSPWFKTLIALLLAIGCSVLFHRFSPAINQGSAFDRVIMAAVMGLEWLLFWWFTGFFIGKALQLESYDRALKALRKRWAKGRHQFEGPHGYLPRDKARPMLALCIADKVPFPFGPRGKNLFRGLLQDYAQGKSHRFLEARLNRIAESDKLRPQRLLVRLRLIPLFHASMAFVKFAGGEPVGLITVTVVLAGVVVLGAHWLVDKKSRLEQHWFTFLHDKCLAMCPMVDPGIHQLTEELVMTRERIALTHQQLVQAERASLDQLQRLSLHLQNRQEHSEHRQHLDQLRWSEWLQIWQRGQARETRQLDALTATLERELGAGRLQESIQHMHSVTETFVTQLDRMLHQLHEKMVIGSENLRATADALRMYVEQGGVADTALLHKSLNDFRQVVQQLTGGFARVETFTERLADLPEAVEGMTRAGTALFQSGNMAQRVVNSFSKLRQQFAELGETLSQQVGRQNTLQEEVGAVLGQTVQAMTRLQTTMNTVEESLAESGRELAAIQNIMERMALGSGF